VRSGAPPGSCRLPTGEISKNNKFFHNGDGVNFRRRYGVLSFVVRVFALVSLGCALCKLHDEGGCNFATSHGYLVKFKGFVLIRAYRSRPSDK
jgi:hypothetical protein